jgi:hypothetical protein
MKSIEGEVVSFNKCQAPGTVELWMNEVGKSMKASMSRIFKGGLSNFNEEHRIEWIQQQPAQVGSIISRVHFVERV